MLLELNHAPLQTLIRHAIECLAEVRLAPERYRIDMEAWHTAIQVKDKKAGTVTPMTRVCLAGSVMARTLKADPTQTLGCSDFLPFWGPLRALNWSQGGWLKEAFEALRLTSRWADRPITEWARDSVGFMADMLALADEVSPHTTRDAHGVPVREGDRVRCMEPSGTLEMGGIYEVERILDPGRIQLTNLACYQTSRFVNVWAPVAPLQTIGRHFQGRSRYVHERMV